MATEDNRMQKTYWKLVNLCSPCYGEGMNLKEEDNYKECTNCNHSFAVVRWGCIGEKGHPYVKRKAQSICCSCSVLLQSCQCCGVHVSAAGNSEEFGLSRRRVYNTVDYRELRAKGYIFNNIVPINPSYTRIITGHQPPPPPVDYAYLAALDYYNKKESVTLSLEDMEDGRFC